MEPSTTPSPPRLAAPGAGLPVIERFFANLMIHWKARRTSREEAVATFAKEQAAILRLVSEQDPARLAQQVLIKRLPGLEDSSRYWSVLMVLVHLRIVNAQIADVIPLLCAGKQPSFAASTASVKPCAQPPVEVIADFEEGCRRFADAVAAQPELQTSAKFAHPWFGPLDAAAWHFMVGFHMQLHRKQMELIIAGLRKL